MNTLGSIFSINAISSAERECLRFSSQWGNLSHTGETEQMVDFCIRLFNTLFITFFRHDDYQ